MASLAQHPGSPYWIACFSTAGGRQLKRTTKILINPRPGDACKASELKKKAMLIAEAYEDAARTKRTEAKTFEVIAALHEALNKKKLVVHCIGDAVNSWLARKKPEIAATSHTFYKSSAEKFL